MWEPLLPPELGRQIIETRGPEFVLDEIKKDAGSRMAKSVAALQQELTKIRTGRAHTSLLDHITVEYYGSQVPLNQVSNVGVEDSRTLTITPWEKDMVQAIEKAIMSSDLGLIRRRPER